jgi:hypothetical protein
MVFKAANLAAQASRPTAAVPRMPLPMDQAEAARQRLTALEDVKEEEEEPEKEEMTCQEPESILPPPGLILPNLVERTTMMQEGAKHVAKLQQEAKQERGQPARAGFGLIATLQDAGLEALKGQGWSASKPCHDSEVESENEEHSKEQSEVENLRKQLQTSRKEEQVLVWSQRLVRLSSIEVIGQDFAPVSQSRKNTKKEGKKPARCG